MGDAENNLPQSKKRAAGREISRDNPGLDDDEEPGKEIGTFKRAPDEVLAGRRIVKVRRHQTSSSQSAPPSNPFAGIQLVTPGSSSFAASAALFEIPNLKALEKNDGKNDVNEESPKDEKNYVNEESSKDEKNNENEESPKVEKNNENEESPKDEKNSVNEESPKDVTNNTDEVGEEAATDYTKKPVITNTENKAELDGKAEEGSVENLNTVNEETLTKSVNESAPEEDKTTEQDNNNEDAASVDKNKKDSPLSSFQQLSSGQNAFSGITGTGFSSSSFSFGVINNGSQLGSNLSTVDLKNNNISSPFSFGSSNNSGSSSLFGDSLKSDTRGLPSMQVVAVETGEEQEKSVFVADSILFQFIDGGWKERGKGEVKVNIPLDNGTVKGRLLMRTRGNYRLVLNASLYPDMKLANMEKKGITFSCINHASEAEDGGLSTFALKFKDAFKVAEFREIVDKHKGKSAGSSTAALKLPENSPNTA